MAGFVSYLDEFCSLYELRPPKWEPPQCEARRICAAMILPPAPADGVSLGQPKVSDADPGINTHLWVIDEDGIPYVLDKELVELNGRRPKHTNLTGGGMAFVGGELWFEAKDRLWVSGGSGRYEPDTEALLLDSCRVFESLGYSVLSLGWNQEIGRARRYLEKV